jgi:stage V sporulation protein S
MDPHTSAPGAPVSADSGQTVPTPVKAHLKVSSRSNPNAVAGAFAAVVRECGRAEVHVVGAGAINQAIKAVAIARGYLVEDDIDLVCIPAFVEIEIDGHPRTAVQLLVEARSQARWTDFDPLRVEHRLDEVEPVIP